MKSERPDLPVTIAGLVRSATLITPLEAPSSRVARWTITSTTLALVSVVIVRMRPDVAAQMVDGWFAWPATSPRTLLHIIVEDGQDIPRLREGSDCDEDPVNIGPLKYSKGYGDYARTLVDAALARRRDS